MVSIINIFIIVSIILINIVTVIIIKVFIMVSMDIRLASQGSLTSARLWVGRWLRLVTVARCKKITRAR